MAEGESIDIDWFCDKIHIRNCLINVIRIERDKKKDVEIDEDEREYEDFYKLVGEGETDERLDKAAELLKDLAEEMGNGFKHMAREMEKGFKEQREYSMKLDSFIAHTVEHNTHLEAILEKLSEK
jgi:hypothetical protein